MRLGRHTVLATLALALLAAPLAVEAQRPKIARLGVLLFATPDTDAFTAIRRGLGFEPRQATGQRQAVCLWTGARDLDIGSEGVD